MSSIVSTDQTDVTDQMFELACADRSINIPRSSVIGRTWVVPLFCLTLFCSSALLFLAEPMFARMVLPLLGGTPAVWNTCMVSFQALLLAAYAWGHFSIRWLGLRRQAILQIVLLLIVAFVLPIAIPHGWRPPTGRSPIWWLLAMLPVGVGLPFFAVAGTAPVLQRWFASTGNRSSADPYFLYAASNLGSMAALLAYPVLLEPLMRLADQSRAWSLGYLALAAMVAGCAFFIGPCLETKPVSEVLRRAGSFAAPSRSWESSSWEYLRDRLGVCVSEPISFRRRVRWIVLAMVPSSLLLGATTFITTDIAAVPLLWIVPLALYLLSFILVFSSRPMLSHRLMVRLLPVSLLSVALFMLGRVAQPVWMVLAIHLAALFFASMVCHGELTSDRPSIARLTDFYLTMSLGGVLGGLFNALLAPLIFHSAVEYPVALIAACALCPVIAGENAKPRWLLDLIVPVMVAILALQMPRLLTVLFGHGWIGLRMIGLGSAIMLAATAIHRRLRFVLSLAALFFIVGTGPAGGQVLAIQRSFFGIHRVVRNTDGPFNDLYHGTTVHGRQCVDASGLPDQPTTPLTYYHRTGPIGQLMLQRMAAGQADHFGVVGMGIGSLAAYAGNGTRLIYYEIDPVVRWMAADSGYFSFLSSAQLRGANVQIIMGDARLTLQKTPANSYDVLVLDAFAGDAIPVHLLTREAMRIYLDKLADGGLLAIHISNMYLNLLPVCAALAEDAGCVGMYQNDLQVSPRQANQGKTASQWVIIARSNDAMAAQMQDRRWKPLPRPGTAAVWTDDFSNILSVFRWR